MTSEHQEHASHVYSIACYHTRQGFGRPVTTWCRLGRAMHRANAQLAVEAAVGGMRVRTHETVGPERHFKVLSGN